MAQTCLNCGNPVMDNYCSNCGQKKFKRIDKKYIWDELQYTVFHTNKGFLYSIKNTQKSRQNCKGIYRWEPRKPLQAHIAGFCIERDCNFYFI